MQIRLNRFDLFHAHLFQPHDRQGLGLLFHAAEYPARSAAFPVHLGYCQANSTLAYAEDAMDLRNIIYYQACLSIPVRLGGARSWSVRGVDEYWWLLHRLVCTSLAATGRTGVITGWSSMPGPVQAVSGATGVCHRADLAAVHLRRKPRQQLAESTLRHTNKFKVLSGRIAVVCRASWRQLM